MTDTRRPVLIYLADDERASLERRAREEGRSLSAMGRRLIVQGLKSDGDPADKRSR